MLAKLQASFKIGGLTFGSSCNFALMGPSVNEIGSEGLLQPEYFSIDDQGGSFVGDNMSSGLEDPSWVEPVTDDDPNRSLGKCSGEFLSETGRDLFDGPRSNDIVGKVETILFETLQKQENLVGVGEAVDELMEKSEDSAGFCSESAQIDEGSGNIDHCAGDSDVGIGSSVNSLSGVESLGEEIETELVKSADDNGNSEVDKIGKRSVIWWKIPIEFLENCLLRMNPVWTVTVAASLMGLVVLARRFYKMSRKTKKLEIEVTFDDKKASQVLSRVARLNEAFAAVKRVPLTRPSLPAVRVTTWPAGGNGEPHRQRFPANVLAGNFVRGN